MKLILVGKSCSGKTSLSKILEKLDYKVAVASTSRPIRTGEIDKKDYHFKSKESFLHEVEEDRYLVYEEFNGWMYGILKEEYENSDLLILNPRVLNNLIGVVGRDDVYIIYIDAESSVRLHRSYLRNDQPSEIIRRYLADENDFKDFSSNKLWDIKIEINNKEKVKKLLSKKELI